MGLRLRHPVGLLRACRRNTSSSSRSFATAIQDGLQVKPIAGSLGAQITGIDLRSITEKQTREVREAWLKHKVIFLRRHELDPGQYLNFARTIGKPSPYPMVPGIEGYPDITHVLKREHETTNFGGIWHSDTV
ncbi:(R)-phenoxypropionate/alpha-ketoglutarate-dioxygenase [Fulvia fulva]|uniref:(R)-phenoxypropionate/alpha-ketoglutarate-dioxygenase n=1 Tax=Passalora fulva TaxID=5499 RepID=A0A9Q8UR29_PASFU|nr:(R)-phenoxypropionate/alpha-ketoglutarate-dioxygenase [Fulvia fulva]KAK4621494.1 (R)-phenoxypropionate/alpha-ketoglutarate-dioxygenase [Fulvia fulva]KAK4623002.1 (R)-phenoxypropionate/alpha-ketoglutarate-dioxygenase [Fulvia fulva]UJO19286.1 (R)-phenoxypropionate/alpha-ketoglutarate-dioxygenase [Fulvia fulva]WPV15990.1 (R)-phenoxypropionate/alpha-ketoglutarate-dioxygenase [Fulvia fulva]WPV31501.1 (R)-phenoxypropionate/alpha-ketoglutarate-dioxygenase [Fulvia fulva]